MSDDELLAGYVGEHAEPTEFATAVLEELRLVLTLAGHEASTERLLWGSYGRIAAENVLIRWGLLARGDGCKPSSAA